MTLAVVAGLIGLALVDSTSLGTLVMPVWMIAHPRLRPSRVVLYLATIALFLLVPRAGATFRRRRR